MKSTKTLTTLAVAVAAAWFFLLRRRGPAPLKPGLAAPRDLDGDGLYEDLDGDGVVTAVDLQLLGEGVVNLLPYMQANVKFFDFFPDGVLDVFDLSAYRQKYGV